jgi:hypothetical protein
MPGDSFENPHPQRDDRAPSTRSWLRNGVFYGAGLTLLCFERDFFFMRYIISIYTSGQCGLRDFVSQLAGALIESFQIILDPSAILVFPVTFEIYFNKVNFMMTGMKSVDHSDTAF